MMSSVLPHSSTAHPSSVICLVMMMTVKLYVTRMYIDRMMLQLMTVLVIVFGMAEVVKV